MKQLLFVMAFCLARIGDSAEAESIATLDATRYFISRSFKIAEGGTLALFQDRRLAGRKDPHQRQLPDDNEPSNSSPDFLPALLVCQTEGGVTLDTAALCDPWAELSELHLYADKRVSYRVECDHQIGFGLGQGFRGRLAEIKAGRIDWLTAVDDRSGRTVALDLINDMVTESKIVTSTAKPAQIFLLNEYQWALPNFELMRRIFLDGQKWVCHSRVGLSRAVELECEKDCMDDLSPYQGDPYHIEVSAGMRRLVCPQGGYAIAVPPDFTDYGEGVSQRSPSYGDVGFYDVSVTGPKEADALIERKMNEMALTYLPDSELIKKKAGSFKGHPTGDIQWVDRDHRNHEVPLIAGDPKDWLAAARVVLVGRRLYWVAYSAKRADFKAKEARRYFDSLEFR